VFIPPHPDGVAELMSDLEQFWHNDALQVPHLVKLAISHYQFETIHPFLDGNGRIGRLLMPLYLVSHGVLAKPSLYLSDFFERNRASYYDSLMRVRVSNDLIHWVRFFLSGVAETAVKGRDVFGKILALRTEVEHAILVLGKRTPNAKRLLNLRYQQPLVSAADIGRELEIKHPTVNAVVRDFVRLGILTEITGQRRGRLYAFDRYLRLFVM
jgi:Fic family protein